MSDSARELDRRMEAAKARIEVAKRHLSAALVDALRAGPDRVRKIRAGEQVPGLKETVQKLGGILLDVEQSLAPALEVLEVMKMKLNVIETGMQRREDLEAARAKKAEPESPGTRGGGNGIH